MGDFPLWCLFGGDFGRIRDSFVTWFEVFWFDLGKDPAFARTFLGSALWGASLIPTLNLVGIEEPSCDTFMSDGNFNALIG